MVTAVEQSNREQALACQTYNRSMIEIRANEVADKIAEYQEKIIVSGINNQGLLTQFYKKQLAVYLVAWMRLTNQVLQFVAELMIVKVTKEEATKKEAMIKEATTKEATMKEQRLRQR